MMQKKISSIYLGCTLALIILFSFFVFFYPQGPKTSSRLMQATSQDGEPIAYTVEGKGDPALVFVHGWSCDSRYWRKQISVFKKKYQVITIDLAGHGHSGMGRSIYTLRSFGEDVNAVVKHIEAKNIILIGHSMGGGVVAQAALLNPDRICGIIGVDHLQNVEQGMPPEQIDQMVENFKKDFFESTKQFVDNVIIPNSNPDLKNWILMDMSGAPAHVGISALYEYITAFNDNKMAEIFEQINIPIRCINADIRPTDIKANRRHMQSFDVAIMPGYGHFLMLENPELFNQHLTQFIDEILHK